MGRGSKDPAGVNAMRGSEGHIRRGPMTLHDYWDILRRSWLLIVPTTVAGRPGRPRPSLLIRPRSTRPRRSSSSPCSPPSEVSGAYTGGLYVQQRIKSYVTVVDSPGVLEPVIDELDLDTKYTQLTDRSRRRTRPTPSCSTSWPPTPTRRRPRRSPTPPPSPWPRRSSAWRPPSPAPSP